MLQDVIILYIAFPGILAQYGTYFTEVLFGNFTDFLDHFTFLLLGPVTEMMGEGLHIVDDN